MTINFKDHMGVIKDVLTSLSLFTGFAFALFTFVWAVAGDNIIEISQKQLGITALQAQQQDIIKEIELRVREGSEAEHLVLQKLTLIEGRLNTAYPNRTTEFDVIRSGVDNEVCRAGEPCEFHFRVRRTIEGAECKDAPFIEGYVINHYGVTHPVQVEWPNTRLTHEWFLVEGTFTFTDSVRPGLAQFYVSRTFNQCPDTFPRPITENGPPILFRVVE